MIYSDLLFNFDQGLRVEREHDLGKEGPEAAGPLQQAGQPLQQVGNKPDGQQIYLFFLSKGYLYYLNMYKNLKKAHFYKP